MGVNILAIGDIMGASGLNIVTEKLRGIKKLYDAAFVVVNGENASGVGLTKDQALEIFDAGADVITLGNHTWHQKGILTFLDDNEHILRPANFAPQVPGRGYGIYETAFGRLAVINLIGRTGMPVDNDNPFHEVDRILKKIDTNLILVDFHAEMTSEKYAMAYYLDGRVSALWGTHTHVQTSDARVFSGGLGYITDLGMTGPIDSVIGMKPEAPISNFLGNPPDRFVPADGPARIEGALFELDIESGKSKTVEAFRIS